MPVYPCYAKKIVDNETGKTRWEMTDATTITDTCPKGCKHVKYTVKTYTKQYEIEATRYACVRSSHNANIAHNWKQQGEPKLIWRSAGEKRYETSWSCGHN